MSDPRTRGTLYGLLAMLSFSITLPATRVAVLHLHPWVVGLGRPVIAGVLAGGLLIATGQRPPARKHWKAFSLVVLGVVMGVPLLFAWGMQNLPSAHGAVTLGLLPLTTALIAALRAGERPSKRFWVASSVGSLAVVAFSMSRGAGRIQVGDLVLVGSVIASAVGYVEGAQLARYFPGWQVISWALVFGAPWMVIPLVFAIKAHGAYAPPTAWVAFAYLATVSQFLGLFAWYKGLSLGGISRIGQLQLLQPFGTILFSALFLGETVTASMVLAATVVVVSVAIGRKAVIEVHHRTRPEVPENF